ncbi:hypothetical protein ACLB1G_01785 [Oxalobacteraceae bacterium A2-2]
MQALLLLAMVAAARAQQPAGGGPMREQAGATEAAVVRVTGVRAVPWKSYRAMAAALAAYGKHKALAPDAIFRFAVMPPPGLALPANFLLRVRTRDGVEFPITLDNGELFELPALPDPGVEADLVSNFKGGVLRIGLLVHTLAVPPEQERLGDARLRCEITEAIADADDPGRNVDQPTRRNGRLQRQSRTYCNARARVLYRPRAATSGATITEAGRKEPLRSEGGAYRLPLSDQAWSNDAIIAFQYQAPMRPLRLAEVAVYSGD